MFAVLLIDTLLAGVLAPALLDGHQPSMPGLLGFPCYF
jgi:hypothetical protein